MEEVKVHGKTLKDKLKEYLRIQDYKELTEEMDQDINDLKEMKNCCLVGRYSQRLAWMVASTMLCVQGNGT